MRRGALCCFAQCVQKCMSWVLRFLCIERKVRYSQYKKWCNLGGRLAGQKWRHSVVANNTVMPPTKKSKQSGVTNLYLCINICFKVVSLKLSKFYPNISRKSFVRCLLNNSKSIIVSLFFDNAKAISNYFVLGFLLQMK